MNAEQRLYDFLAQHRLNRADIWPARQPRGRIRHRPVYHHWRAFCVWHMRLQDPKTGVVLTFPEICAATGGRASGHSTIVGIFRRAQRDPALRLPPVISVDPLPMEIL